MRNREVSTPIVVVVIVVLLAIVGFYGYRTVIASPHQNVSPEQQKENMKHMIRH